MGGTAAVVGIVVSVVGAAGKIYTSQVAAADADRERKRLKEQAERDALIHKEQAEKLRSKQRAAYAASGVLTDVGSPLDVIEQTQKEAAEERQAIMRGYGFRMDTLEREASRMRLGGFISGAGTLLGGIGQYAESPYAVNPFAQFSKSRIGTPPT